MNNSVYHRFMRDFRLLLWQRMDVLQVISAIEALESYHFKGENHKGGSHD